jgi:hypothetical protein
VHLGLPGVYTTLVSIKNHAEVSIIMRLNKTSKKQSLKVVVIPEWFDAHVVEILFARGSLLSKPVVAQEIVKGGTLAWIMMNHAHKKVFEGVRKLYS